MPALLDLTSLSFRFDVEVAPVSALGSTVSLNRAMPNKSQHKFPHPEQASPSEGVPIDPNIIFTIIPKYCASAAFYSSSNGHALARTICLRAIIAHSCLGLIAPSTAPPSQFASLYTQFNGSNRTVNGEI